jgi:hypothetical protein
LVVEKDNVPRVRAVLGSRAPQLYIVGNVKLGSVGESGALKRKAASSAAVGGSGRIFDGST